MAKVPKNANEQIANHAAAHATVDKQTASMLLNKEVVGNAHLLRSQLMTQMFNIGKDINQECGYPDVITREMFAAMYEREGLAKRVVNVMPEESWVMPPDIRQASEEEGGGETDKTAFDKAWVELEKEHHLFHYLERVDMLSGIGRFGVMLLGISDGLPLDRPVAGMDERTGKAAGTNKYELLYLRPFQEANVTVDQYESDTTHPRYGKPKLYNIIFQDQTTTAGQVASQQSAKVHWTRVIHVADNRESSDTFGSPRMEGVYNRLLDVRKVLSGSGEMFWKGAFPGYSFEINPDQLDPEVDSDDIKETFDNYSNGLQRYLALAGVTAKSLAPQVADPSKHVETQVKIIALSLGVPWRILMGSEAAQLASGQDKETMNMRTGKRRENYLTPLVVRTLVDRLIAYGVLEDVEYVVDWPDLNTTTDKEKAEVANITTEAFSKYMQGNVDQLIPPLEYFTMILGMDKDQAKEIEAAATEHIVELEEKEATELAAAEESAATAEAQQRERTAIAGGEPDTPVPNAD